MRHHGLIALLLLPVAVVPAAAGRTGTAPRVLLALPAQQPEAPPPRPVGDPDTPPISLDLYDVGSSHEEAWPWPPLPTDD